jgi:hypothetical protein
MPTQTFDTIESLYDHLSPSTLATTAPGVSGATQTPSFSKSLADLVMDPKIFHPTSVLVSALNKFLEGANPEDKKRLSDSHHIITKTGPIKLGDDDYWGKVSSVTGLMTSPTDSKEAQDSSFDCAVIATKDPYMSPATKDAEVVEYFLNYTPSFAAAQMVPFLDIQFHFLKPAQEKDNLTFPSTLRFLMGSNITSTIDNDRIMFEASGTTVPQDQGGGFDAMSGLEIFLAPQTLVNMDNLDVLGTNRLVRPKPFLPFASIEGFDVTIQNAGAGAFANKKGNLKLKIHDKSRMSEFSEIVRGQVGFMGTTIETTYGWRAPMGSNTDRITNDYARFVNENMTATVTWSVVNVNFSFDATGQVSAVLELVSKAAADLRKVHVSDGGNSGASKQFDALVQQVAELQRKASQDPKFGLAGTPLQVLNTAATTGNFTDFKAEDLATAVNNITTSLANNSQLTPEDQRALKDALTKLTSGDFTYSKVSATIGNEVQVKFETLSGEDPFLAFVDGTTESSKLKYFNSDLIAAVKGFKGSLAQRSEAIAASKKEDKDNKRPFGFTIKDDASAASFGKLFLNFAVPAIAKSRICRDLQIIFYSLNDSCGPLSGHSVAEFPVDVMKFSYAYAETVRESGTDSLTLEAFFRLLVDNQVVDQTAIGYGMNRFYPPFTGGSNESNSRGEEDKAKKLETENGLAAWTKRYGVLKPPMLEIFVETGRIPVTAGGTTSQNVIKRIHIYDKQNNPYKFVQDVIDTGDGQLTVGGAKNRTDQLSKIISSNFNSTNQDKLKKLLDDLKAAKDDKAAAAALAANGVPQDQVNSYTGISAPNTDSARLPRNVQSFKEQLMRFVPNIMIGANGTLVQTVNVASKTDGQQAAINIINASKGYQSGKAVMSSNGLEENNNLPMRSQPVSVSLTSHGVPIARLYQTYFIDFGTGTSIDNIYSCNTLTHSLVPGKFTTTWNFLLMNGYPRFGSPQSKTAILTGELEDRLSDLSKPATPPDDKSKQTKKAAPKPPAKKSGK